MTGALQGKCKQTSVHLVQPHWLLTDQRWVIRRPGYSGYWLLTSIRPGYSPRKNGRVVRNPNTVSVQHNCLLQRKKNFKISMGLQFIHILSWFRSKTSTFKKVLLLWPLGYQTQNSIESVTFSLSKEISQKLSWVASQQGLCFGSCKIEDFRITSSLPLPQIFVWY